MPRWFKGMEVMIREWGLWPEQQPLAAQCTEFHCPPIPTDCCCQRLLFTQPDFDSQKSQLQELIEGRSDTLSLPWLAGNGLECAVCGVDKPAMRRPLRVLILRLSGQQIQIDVWINLIRPRVHAAASGVGTVGCSEPVVNEKGRALLHVACNVVWVVTRFGYTSDKSVKGCGHVRQCREHGQATQSLSWPLPWWVLHGWGCALH